MYCCILSNLLSFRVRMLDVLMTQETLVKTLRVELKEKQLLKMKITKLLTYVKGGENPYF